MCWDTTLPFEGCRVPLVTLWWSLSRPAGDAHQRVEAFGRIEQLAADAGENDRAALEHERFVGKFEGQPGVLFDQNQRQMAVAFEAGERGQERIDNGRRQA